METPPKTRRIVGISLVSLLTIVLAGLATSLTNPFFNIQSIGLGEFLAYLAIIWLAAVIFTVAYTHPGLTDRDGQ